ncbi:unnamed protein product [marine sediment metagenome]|uniref:Uncharacterized protein n=1 Tax=marine sediment metagenome TaxID=412755 RepID=X1IU43_9ZZZZ
MCYDENLIFAQDFKLWVDIAQVSKLANIPEVLLLYFFHEEQMSEKYKAMQRDNTLKINKKIVENFLGRTINSYENKIHTALISKEIHNIGDLQEVEKWASLLKKKNLKIKAYNKSIYNEYIDNLKTTLGKKHYYRLIKGNRYKLVHFFRLLSFRQKYYLYFDFFEIIKLFIKCLIGWEKK